MRKLPLIVCFVISSFNNKPITVKTSIYHATTKQTDKYPLITASGIKIDTNKLRHNTIRYVSLSRDLARGIHYGKFIYVISDNPKYSGRWKFVDVMNSRFTKRIDFLQHSNNKNKPPTLIQIQM